MYIHSFISIQPWKPGLAGTRAQSCEGYCSGTLYPGQVLGGSLPLLSPAFRRSQFSCQVPPSATDDFFRPKNPTASVGFEPANLGTKGQHTTPRTPKPLYIIYNIYLKRREYCISNNAIKFLRRFGGEIWRQI